MLWRRSVQTPAPSPSHWVPEGEAVRLSALQASWRRDRWVARRRIALRWVTWAAWRYGLPALGLMAALAITWRVVLGWPGDSHTASPATAPTRIPDAIDAVQTPASPPTEDEPPVKLRFEPTWPAVRPTPQPNGASDRATDPDLDAFPPLTPLLKPENWLHSKEP
jgi:hypothetical protein